MACARASSSRQRWLTFCSMFVGWSFYYFTRKCFVSTMGELRRDRGFTLDQLGTIASSFSLSYGISKFLSALLSDVASSKLLFSSGLGVCGICVIVFPLCPSSLLCCVVWGIAGLLQGFGWPACAKLLKAWYPPERVGTWWSVLSSSGNMAAAISPLFITYISQFTSWETSYYIIGSVALILSLLFLKTITDTPEESVQAVTVQKKQSQERVSYFQLFTSLELLAISVVYFMLYVAKGAVCDWALLYFTEHTKMSSPFAATCIGIMQIGGILGNIVWGYMSDMLLNKVPKGSSAPRAPTLVVNSVFLLITVHLFSSLNNMSSYAWISLVSFLFGLVLEGGVAIIGLLAMECVPDQLSGSAHGLACAFGQFGNMLSGYPFSLIVKGYGWQSGYQIVEISVLISVIASSFVLYRALTPSLRNCKQI